MFTQSHVGHVMASRLNLNWLSILTLTWLWLLSTAIATRRFSGTLGSTVSIPRVKNPRYSPENKTLTADGVLDAYAAAFLKHNMIMLTKLEQVWNKRKTEIAVRPLEGRQDAEVQGSNSRAGSNGE